jgi:hypothetical protein
VLGAYRWHLTLDVTKWLLDWHLVRGTNLFYEHACFYSIRGRRAFESEPDLGVHNVWWPYFGLLTGYANRLSWLLSDGQPVCEVAVLTDEYQVKWAAAEELLRAQIDYCYVYGEPVLGGHIEGNGLVIGHGRFRAVVCDPAWVITPEVKAKLDAFRAAGGVVVEHWTPGGLAGELVQALGQDLAVEGQPAPELRVAHYRKGGWDFYLLVNEGEERIERRVSLAATGGLELWDALDGSMCPWPARLVDGRLETAVRLERRQGLVLAVDAQRGPAAEASYRLVPGEVVQELSGPWQATDLSGNSVDVPSPGDWSHVPGWELFSGTLCFTTRFELPEELAGRRLFLDLGQVGDIAEVRLNGGVIGVRAWAPYVLALGEAVRPGRNTLEVRVTNSMANAYDGAQLSSGLLSPVSLRRAVEMDPRW